MKKLISLILLCSAFSFASCVSEPSESDETANSETNTNNTTDNASNENTENKDNYDDFTLSEKTVELDCGSTRTSWKHNSSLQGGTSAAFPTNIDISANIPANLNGKVKIEWSIPEADKDYFSLDTNTGTNVKVTATNPSRLSTLTAKMINTSNNSVLKETICELRSVMINTYWIGEQDRTDNKISGCDITGYASGYTARFFSSNYGENYDIVFPSKLTVKINDQNVTRNVCRIVGLATSDGGNGIAGSSVATCRYLYVPNTVYMFSGSALCFTHPNKTFFQSGGVNYTYFDSNSIVNETDGNSRFVGSINFTDGTFPYVSYANVEGENLSNKPTFDTVTYSVLFNKSRANKMLLSKGE